MRFAAIRGRGIGVSFPDEFSVDLESIPGPLVAVTGENGAGKSTFLELFGASMYRVCPTRGSLSDLATRRDSFLETVVVNGSSHRIRHVVDAVSGKAEAVVTDEQGNPLVASAKLKEFDAWAAKHLPPREVFYASMFAAQKAQGFLDMKPSERKSVLLRVLGIEHYEALAEKAREHARDAKAAGATLDARIRDERARSLSPEAVEAEHKALIAQRSELENALATARAELDKTLAAEQLALAAQQDVSAHRARRTEIQARLQLAEKKLSDVAERLKNNAGVLARADEIRAAKARADEIDATINDLATRAEAGRGAVSTAQTALEVATAAAGSLRQRLSATNLRADRARSRCADKAAVAEAAKHVARLPAKVEGLEADVARHELGIRTTQDLIVNSATNRITGLRAGLETIAADGECDRPFVARGALTADDEASALAAEAPATVEEHRRQLKAAQLSLATMRKELQAAERMAARADEVAAAETELAEALAEAAALETEIAEVDRSVVEKTADIATARAASVDLDTAWTAASSERETLRPLTKLAEPLMQAEARLAELQPQHAAHTADVAALKVELEQLGAAPADTVLPDVAGAKARVENASRAIASLDSTIAVTVSQMEEARAAEKRLAALLTERRAADAEVADWTRLADDLGRDGLQALEIDAAGPELTALVNDLLHTCVGPRWTVSIQASRLSADGKKVLEGCEVTVLDTEKGRDGEAGTLSGGESIIVGEAVSLALSMLACRRSGVQGPTLVRDETGAALDPKNAVAYVAMLRRACELVGASRCFFVSHSADVQALADARLEVGGGQVRLAA